MFRFSQHLHFILCVLSLFFLTSQVFALGFKNPKTFSFLNQPLQFQVDITDNSKSLPTEQYSIITSISDSEFGSQNIMEFDSKIVSKTKEKKIVLVTTRQNVREPFMQLRLQLNRDGMSVSRIFNILLEPPILLTTASGENYLVKVKSADTVWLIAERFLQDNLFSIEQMMMAIYRLNPDAFLGENINRLKSNSELLMPSIETVASLSKEEAKKLFLEQYDDWKNQNYFQDQNLDYGEQPALKVLSSGETRALEIGKNKTSIKLEQSAFIKPDSDLKIQLERSQEAMSLLEKKFDEQSEELSKMRAEIESLKLNSEKNLTSPVLNSSDSKTVVNFWFYLLLGSFFALAVGIGFVLFKKSKARIRQMDISFANEDSDNKAKETIIVSGSTQNPDLQASVNTLQNSVGADNRSVDSEPDPQIILSINSYLAYERYEDAIRESKSALDKFPYSVELHILLLKIFKDSCDAQNFDSHYSKIRDLFDPETDEWRRVTEKYQTFNSELSEKLAKITSPIDADLDLDLDLDIDIGNNKDMNQKDDKDMDKN